MSFLSVGPQSRVVLESHSDSLLAQFDTHLQTLTDRYLAFFQERREIEATYINSLRKLYRKAKNIDCSFNTRPEPTNVRAAWNTVRDSLKREANTKQAFIDILDRDVIGSFTKLKEFGVEVRKMTEQDLTESASDYANFAENRISKLQLAYLKKYYPRQYSQFSQDAPNKKLGGKKSVASHRQQSIMLEPAQSDDDFDDSLRGAVFSLNNRRLARAEKLREGYDVLEDLIFMPPTVNDVLEKYMNGMITISGKYHNQVMSTKAAVKDALAGRDESDLRVSFRQALCFSIPPVTLYRNYNINRPGPYSRLIFGAPLVDLKTTQDNVPKVMRMCIEEVEKRGLRTTNIYLAENPFQEEVLQLRRRFECDKSFSFSSTDNIQYIAMLLKLYLWELPEPLFMLSLRDYLTYKEDREGGDSDNNLLFLRSTIHAQNPIHRASLRALLRHLSRVASHSDENKMTVDVLATAFAFAVSRQSEFMNDSGSPCVKELVLVDLIQNVHTIFDERTPLSLPVPSPNVTETTFTSTVDLSSFSLLSDSDSESRLTPSLTPFSNPHGIPPSSPSSQTLKEGVETTTQDRVVPKATEIRTVETLSNSSIALPEASAQVAPSSVAEWRLRVPSQLSLQTEAPTIPPSPTESVVSSISECHVSSATSLQTTLM